MLLSVTFFVNNWFNFIHPYHQVDSALTGETGCEASLVCPTVWDERTNTKVQFVPKLVSLSPQLLSMDFSHVNGANIRTCVYPGEITSFLPCTSFCILPYFCYTILLHERSVLFQICLYLWFKSNAFICRFLFWLLNLEKLKYTVL